MCCIKNPKFHWLLSRVYCGAVCWLVLCFPSQFLWAQASYDRIFPQAISVGQTSQFKLEGKLGEWPIRVECDRADIQIDFLKDKGSFEIQVSGDAPEGVAWLRFYDSSVVSKAMPVLIEPSKVDVESEGNDLPQEAQEIDVPISISGRLSKSEDVDCFRLSLKAGQQLRAQVVGKQVLNSPMDAVLQIVDQRGNVLAQQDDQRGLDPQISFEAPDDGKYCVRVFAFPETPNSTIGFSGGADYNYVLRLDTSSRAEYFLPLVGQPADGRFQAVMSDGRVQFFNSTMSPEKSWLTSVVRSKTIRGWQWNSGLPAPNPTAVFENDGGELGANPVEAPCILSGRISTPREIDRYKVDFPQGRKMRLTLYSQELGYQLDSKISVHDENGKQLAQNDDRASKQYDSNLDFVAKTEGPFWVQVEDIAESGGLLHCYSLLVQEVIPSVRLTVAKDRYSIDPGGKLELPVSIQRRDGFKQKLSLSVEGLPAEFDTQNATSAASGDTSKLSKIMVHASDSVKPGHYHFHVSGAAEDSKADFTATFPLNGNCELASFWLTVPEAAGE